MPRRTRPFVLTRPDQLRAVTNVVAHQIVSVMERLESATVSELEGHVGVPASSLYYHVRKLESAGILAAVAKRSTGGRDEVVYELTGSEVIVDPAERSPRFLAELARSVRSRLRALERWYLAALSNPDTERTGRRRNLSLHQHHARLAPGKRKELYRRIEELEAFLVENDDPRHDFLHVTLAVVPVARNQPGARPPA